MLTYVFLIRKFKGDFLEAWEIVKDWVCASMLYKNHNNICIRVNFINKKHNLISGPTYFVDSETPRTCTCAFYCTKYDTKSKKHKKCVCW